MTNVLTDDTIRSVSKTQLSDDICLLYTSSSFNTITEAELAEHGVNIVIYANQLTRSAFPAMEQTAKDILKYHRAKEVDSRLMPIKQILTLIDEL